MTEPTTHMNHDHVYTGSVEHPGTCHCGAVEPDTTQRDELRHRIFEIIHVRTCEECQVENDDGTPQGAFAAADAVLAVRDEELEDLRTAAQYNQDRLGQRAKAAEAKLVAVREHVQRLEVWCGDPDASATIAGSICRGLARALDGDDD